MKNVAWRLIYFFRNSVAEFWPGLLDVPGFLQQFITPIVKATKGKRVMTFFTLPEYDSWLESTGNNGRGWTIKYYKGLGTSTVSFNSVLGCETQSTCGHLTREHIFYHMTERGSEGVLL